MACRLATILVLFLVSLLTAPASAQFRREQKPVTEPKVDPLQVALIMSHAIDQSGSGDPAFVDFSPDSQVLYVAGPVGPIPPAPRAHYGKDSPTITGLEAAADSVDDGTTKRRRGFRPEAPAVTAFRVKDRAVLVRFVAQPPEAPLEEWLQCADLSPDGKYLAAVGGRSDSLYLFDAATGKRFSILERTEDRRIFSAEKAVFVTVGETLHVLTEQSRMLNLHRIPDCKIVDKIDLGDDKFDYQSGLSATPDGKLFTVGTTVWDATRAELLSYQKSTGSQPGEIAPSGREVLFPSVGDLLRWNRTDEKPRKAFQHVNKPRINAVALSSDERLIAIARGTDIARDQVSIDLFDFGSEKHLRRLEGHLSTIHALAFSPDGKLLASASRDGSTRLWNVAELK